MTAKKPAKKPAKATKPRAASKRKAVARSVIPRYAVTVASHRLDRWEVPAATMEVHAATLDGALALAALSFHVRAGIPPLRSYTAITLTHLTARKVQLDEPLPAEEFR